MSSSDPSQSSSTKSGASLPSAILRSVIVGGLIGAILSVLFGAYAQRAVFDTWQRVSPREISMDNVAVVLVDDASVEDLGAWPWSRYTMARLIAEINAAGPAAIGVDIYFTEPDPLRPEAFASLYGDEELDADTRAKIAALPNIDKLLGEIVGRGPVVLARFATENGGLSPDEVFYNSVVEGEAPVGILKRDQLVASISTIDANALSHAMVNGPPDGDGVVRRVPAAVMVGENSLPGFALELARVASGTQRLEWDSGRILADGNPIPTDASGNLRFKMGYYPAPALYSAAAVARGQIPADAFEGKVVLVGVGATGTFDIVATPLRNEIYGVLVQATAVDALLEGEWLSRPGYLTALEIGASLILVCLVFSAGLSLRPWLVSIALALALTLPLASWIAFDQVNLLFDPVRPFLVGASAAVALVVTRYSLARAERARLAAELVEQRVLASEQEGELKAARRIQMSMVPSEQVLAKLDPRTEIGAVLEPAKSVGGDFYDAARIGEDSVIFVVGDVTGKGVPAALFMALSKSLAKSNLARPTDDLGTAVAELNRDLMDEADEEMGLTLMVGVLDCTTGRIALVNAGHENPLRVRQGGAIENVELRGGPPLCVIDFPYQVETLQLSRGDTLIVLTDGATEAANASDELFGIDGVIAALQNVRGSSAAHRVSHLAKEVRLFEGSTDPSDDLTIFALRYVGEAYA
ncbi:MAG: CHASE2 domain-containing protein [Pseudomonadota bacterium]